MGVSYEQFRRLVLGQRIGGPDGGATTEADGTIVFDGDATYWVDIDFPIIIRTTGPNIPVLTAVRGNITAPQWSVGDFSVCEGQEMIHGYKEETPIQWHIHTITAGTDVDDRFIAFEVEWFYAKPSQQLSGGGTNFTTTSGDLLIPANTPDRTQLQFNIGAPQDMTGVGIATHVYARLARVAASGTAPTADPFCTMLQVHIECDTLGSREITTK